MSDHVEHLLDELGRDDARAIPAPPRAFLAAVSRRRRQRRLMQVAATAAAVVVLGGVGLLTRQALLRPQMAPSQPVIASVAPAPASLVGLARLNPDLSTDALRFPPDTGIDLDQPLQIGMRWDPAQVEQWVSR